MAHALYRRLITPRGTLRGSEAAAAYGFDVSGYVGAVGYPAARQAFSALVTGELLKDDRVLPTLEVVATLVTGDNGEDSIELSISGTHPDSPALSGKSLSSLRKMFGGDCFSIPKAATLSSRNW